MSEQTNVKRQEVQKTGPGQKSKRSKKKLLDILVLEVEKLHFVKKCVTLHLLHFKDFEIFLLLVGR